MTNFSEEIEKSTIIMEHASLIQNYQQTGMLDRQNALKKYKSFNARYPRYMSDIAKAASATNSSILIDEATDSVIANNLILQLRWLQGKSLF